MIDEIPSQLNKETKSDMKEVVDECTEEIFNKWIEGEIMHENFDIRKNILKLSEKEDIIKYKEYVYDRTTFENHGKTVLLMKDNMFIKEKSQDMMSNSYKEFGIHNIFSKIELLGIYEKETQIKRFKYDDATPTVKDATWNMILKLFRKSTKKPENKNDAIKEYVGMVNNILLSICFVFLDSLTFIYFANVINHSYIFLNNIIFIFWFLRCLSE